MGNLIYRGDILAFYAVKKGRKLGIYKTWSECEEQVKGYSDAKYKKFKTLDEARSFIGNEEIEEKIPLIEENKNESKKDNSLIDIDLEDDEVIAYVDGSFDLASFTYSYGVVYISNEGKTTYSGRESDKDLAAMRNVSGELRGAIEAMKIAQEDGKKRLYLHYDYMGIEEWAQGHWKTNKDGTRRYKEFYDEIKKDLKVVFVKVKAHAGIKYNEEADKLAKEAL